MINQNGYLVGMGSGKTRTLDSLSDKSNFTTNNSVLRDLSKHSITIGKTSDGMSNNLYKKINKK